LIKLYQKPDPTKDLAFFYDCKHSFPVEIASPKMISFLIDDFVARNDGRVVGTSLRAGITAIVIRNTHKATCRETQNINTDTINKKKILV